MFNNKTKKAVQDTKPFCLLSIPTARLRINNNPLNNNKKRAAKRGGASDESDPPPPQRQPLALISQ
jgi:hypothetical protein